LRCVHCYHPHHSNRDGIGLPEWKKIIEEYSGLMGKLRLAPSFVLCGGEPLLSPFLIPILDELSGRWSDARIAITTNGTPLDRAMVRRLSRYNTAFQISLDGPDAIRHDAVRGSGAFDAAMSGLAALQEAGRNARFLAVLSERSSHWIADFFAEAGKRRAEAMNFVRFISQGVGRGYREQGRDRPLGPVELQEAMTRVARLSRESGIHTNTNQPLYALVDPALGAHGQMGFQGVIVDYRGRLKVSSRTDFFLGNILEEGLENLFLNHPIMKSLRSARIEGCHGCVYYSRCGGDRNSSFAEFGSFLKKDPGCWI